jgi:lipid II:glycine glycyltransferase (peptidoglycan interpeptide bridge formation enzyme)
MLTIRSPIALSNGVTSVSVVEAAARLGCGIKSSSGFFMLDLEVLSPERIWHDIFSRRGPQRKLIRRLDREGFTAEFAKEEDLFAFAELHNSTVSKAGGKGHSYGFLRKVLQHMGPANFRILLIKQNARILAGLGFFANPEKRLVHFMYGAYEDKLETRINHTYLVAFWRAIEWAGLNGYSTINFGSTTASQSHSNYKFKKQFGGVFVPKYTISQYVVPKAAYSFFKRVF